MKRCLLGPARCEAIARSPAERITRCEAMSVAPRERIGAERKVEGKRGADDFATGSQNKLKKLVTLAGSRPRFPLKRLFGSFLLSRIFLLKSAPRA